MAKFTLSGVDFAELCWGVLPDMTGLWVPGHVARLESAFHSCSDPMQPKSEFLYAAYFCEENIWQLANAMQSSSAKIVFISNQERQCALWNQRLASPGKSVVWDYHVVLLEENQGSWLVYDFDSVLAWGVSLQQYLIHTFGQSVDAIFQPQFRMLAATEFLTNFQSDRRHMRDRNGRWLKPPPDWPIISNGSGHNLDQFIDMEDAAPGEVYDLMQITEQFAQNNVAT